ncbi:hypothetical protein KIPB_002918 [Kipferlia bialata]|uniref:Uncharacterized protein n=1 Tax=Kipferlia bialata TaxID=797122 RepID=A0A9K3GH17_9EUKA|nr:hypothetical protein KIPB_002918 [Kipferlia bialata]|eukprot:g2918.t1
MVSPFTLYPPSSIYILSSPPPYILTPQAKANKAKAKKLSHVAREIRSRYDTDTASLKDQRNKLRVKVKSLDSQVSVSKASSAETDTLRGQLGTLQADRERDRERHKKELAAARAETAAVKAELVDALEVAETLRVTIQTLESEREGEGEREGEKSESPVEEDAPVVESAVETEGEAEGEGEGEGESVADADAGTAIPSFPSPTEGKHTHRRQSRSVSAGGSIPLPPQPGMERERERGGDMHRPFPPVPHPPMAGSSGSYAGMPPLSSSQPLSSALSRQPSLAPTDDGERERERERDMDADADSLDNIREEISSLEDQLHRAEGDIVHLHRAEGELDTVGETLRAATPRGHIKRGRGAFSASGSVSLGERERERSLGPRERSFIMPPVSVSSVSCQTDVRHSDVVSADTVSALQAQIEAAAEREREKELETKAAEREREREAEARVQQTEGTREALIDRLAELETYVEARSIAVSHFVSCPGPDLVVPPVETADTECMTEPPSTCDTGTDAYASAVGMRSSFLTGIEGERGRDRAVPDTGDLARRLTVVTEQNRQLEARLQARATSDYPDVRLRAQVAQLTEEIREKREVQASIEREGDRLRGELTKVSSDRDDLRTALRELEKREKARSSPHFEGLAPMQQSALEGALERLDQYANEGFDTLSRQLFHLRQESARHRTSLDRLPGILGGLRAVCVGLEGGSLDTEATAKGMVQEAASRVMSDVLHSQDRINGLRHRHTQTPYVTTAEAETETDVTNRTLGLLSLTGAHSIEMRAVSHCERGVQCETLVSPRAAGHSGLSSASVTGILRTLPSSDIPSSPVVGHMRREIASLQHSLLERDRTIVELETRGSQHSQPIMPSGINATQGLARPSLHTTSHLDSPTYTHSASALSGSNVIGRERDGEMETSSAPSQTLSLSVSPTVSKYTQPEREREEERETVQVQSDVPASERMDVSTPPDTTQPLQSEPETERDEVVGSVYGRERERAYHAPSTESKGQSNRLRALVAKSANVRDQYQSQSTINRERERAHLPAEPETQWSRDIISQARPLTVWETLQSNERRGVHTTQGVERESEAAYTPLTASALSPVPAPASSLSPPVPKEREVVVEVEGEGEREREVVGEVERERERETVAPIPAVPAPYRYTPYTYTRHSEGPVSTEGSAVGGASLASSSGSLNHTKSPTLSRVFEFSPSHASPSPSLRRPPPRPISSPSTQDPERERERAVSREAQRHLTPVDILTGPSSAVPVSTLPTHTPYTPYTGTFRGSAMGGYSSTARTASNTVGHVPYTAVLAAHRERETQRPSRPGRGPPAPSM